MTEPLRVAINGFGRIGRNVLRAWVERGFDPALDLVAVNDLWDGDTLAHLLRYDSAHGRFWGQVIRHHDPERLHVQAAGGSRELLLLRQADPAQLPWAVLGVDVVLECTGRFRSRAQASQHLHAGAGRVIIGAAPFDSVDAAVVYGLNHQALRPGDRVISSVSCTTQALGPLLAVLDAAFGIESALMTEIHAVTADQTVLDQGHRDLRRARASGYNIIPTTSSAIAAVQQVLPWLESRIEGYSIRVPTLDVAAIDLGFVSRQPVTAAQVNACLQQAAQGPYAGIMAYCDEPLVSTDFIHHPASLIIDSLQTHCAGTQTKVLAWYDNEWGYANRLLDLCGHLGQMGAG